MSARALNGRCSGWKRLPLDLITVLIVRLPCRHAKPRIAKAATCVNRFRARFGYSGVHD